MITFAIDLPLAALQLRIPASRHSYGRMKHPSSTVAPATGSEPAIPVTPFLQRDGLRTRGRSRTNSLLDAPALLLTTSGRAAIALALRALKIGAGDEVLIPAYHCVALSAPIDASNAVAVSYRVQSDLSVNVEDLKKRITQRTRCVIIVHYFGFPQPAESIRAICDLAGIALIEDCAHAFYSSPQSPPIGGYGDYSVGSLMKFFPIFDGGCLASYRQPIGLEAPLHTSGMLYQLRAAIHILEYSARWSHSRILRLLTGGIVRAGTLLKRVRPEWARDVADASPSAVYGDVKFEERWANSQPAVASRIIVRHTNHARSIERRRVCYQMLAEGLTSAPGAKPFRADLPDGVAPYVFPLLLSEPALMYPALRAAGVPMYRWDEADEKECTETGKLKYHLVQLPCHQGLANSDIQKLIVIVHRVLSQVRAAQASSAKPLSQS